MGVAADRAALVRHPYREHIGLVDVNPRLTERINSVLSKTTGGQASASEISYEVYYGIAVAPGMTLKPFFGFMSQCPVATTPTRNADW
jgi:hypothetical protein